MKAKLGVSVAVPRDPFAVVTGCGSSGGTARIKKAVLAFPRYAEIPASYKRSGNPGVVIVVA